jgi:hypothetical protein
MARSFGGLIAPKPKGREFRHTTQNKDEDDWDMTLNTYSTLGLEQRADRGCRFIVLNDVLPEHVDSYIG